VKGLADEIVGENLGGANGSEDGENQLELMHQPLSVALWISQALMPIGMPQWFGPLNKNEPTTLRVALHIQVSFIIMFFDYIFSSRLNRRTCKKVCMH